MPNENAYRCLISEDDLPKLAEREKERIIYSEIEAKMCECFLKRLTGEKGGK